MKTLTIRLSEDEYNSLVTEARQQQMSVVEYASWLIGRRDSTRRSAQRSTLPSGAPYVEKG